MMKNFFKNIVAFSIFVCLSLTLFQIIISFKIKDKILGGHDNFEYTTNVNADLVFLGSSRCWTHFDPHFFDTTFHLKSINIGVDGHSDLAMIITRFNDYLSRNTPPKFAILNFDPLINSGSFTDNKNFVHKDYFARYAFMPNKKILPVVNYFKFNFYEKYVPLYAIFKYNLLKPALLPQKINTWQKYGYEMHPEKWDTTIYPLTEKSKNFYFTKNDILSITNSLDSLKKICLLNNVKLLCIQTPVYKLVNDDIFLESGKICNNLNIPYIDLTTMDIKNDMSYFYHSTHMNTKGVNSMNELLKNDKILNSFFKAINFF